MHTPNHKSAFTRAGIHILAGVALLGVSLGVWASSSSDVPSMSSHNNDKSMQQRGLFSEVGYYLAHNTYGSLGYLRFEYIGSSNDLHAHGTAANLLGGRSLPDSGTTQSNQGTVGASIGLFIPKTHHHLSVEFGLAPPIKFDFQLTGAGQSIGSGKYSPLAAQALGGPLGKQLGTFKALPPNFTLVLRPFTHTVIQPYIGAGAMWLHTYDAKVTNGRLAYAASNPPLNATPAHLNLSQPWACVFQAGFDIELPKPLFFKFDAKYVGCATVDAKLDLGKGNVPTPQGSFRTNLGSITTKNNYQAMLYQASFGINF